MTEPTPDATATPRYRYYTGTVSVPGDGSIVPVCRVGPGGCLIQTAQSAPGVYIGGPDVTTSTGFPAALAGWEFVPSTAPIPPAVVPTPPADVITLYACATRSAEIFWMSGHP